jgi:sugar phosphate isomerase/epimerase
MSSDDDRWDRSPLSLADGVTPPVGICWDIANQWLGSRETDLPAAARAAVRHIHLHDSRPDLTLHAPLDTGAIHWRGAITRFLEQSPWQGCVTLEIRYRYASEIGEPWSVLEDSIRHAARVLNHGAS